MKKPKICATVVFMVGIVLILAGCTENPVGGDPAVKPFNSVISGNVKLSSGFTDEDVYVWLDGFNLGTRTDEKGNFAFVLPPPSSQSNSDGVSGAFNVYYYIANFNLATTQVFTQKGAFLYSNGELDERGELRTSKRLIQNLRVFTNVRPQSVSIAKINASGGTSDFLLRVDVSMISAKDTTVVFFPRKADGRTGPLMFRNTESNEVKFFGSTFAGLVSSDYDTVDTNPSTRTMVLPVFPDDFEPGRYEVIPYFFVENEDVPRDLIKSIGEDVENFSEEYLLIPIKREGVQRFFTVLP